MHDERQGEVHHASGRRGVMGTRGTPNRLPAPGIRRKAQSADPSSLHVGGDGGTVLELANRDLLAGGGDGSTVLKLASRDFFAGGRDGGMVLELASRDLLAEGGDGGLALKLAIRDPLPEGATAAWP